MLKLLHIADVHLGAKFVELGPKGSNARTRIAETFSKIPALAKENSVNLVLIAGDLFDSPFPSKVSVETVNKMIAELTANDICVAISAGTHDYLSPGSVFVTGQIDTSSENVFVFDKPEPMTHLFPKLAVAVSARSLDSNRAHKSPLEGLKPDPQAQINIAMAHGSVALAGLKIPPDDWVMKGDELSKAPFDYIALGHWHSAKEMVPKKAWYSGSPEWISTDQKGSGNVIIGTIDGDKKEFTAVAVGSTSFDTTEIDLGAIKSAEALKEKILEKADKNLIRLVVLKGVRSEELVIDPKVLGEELGVDFEVLKISDQSIVKVEIDPEEEKTLVSEYISSMNESAANAKSEPEKQEIEEAAWLGARLLKGQDSGL